MWMVKSSDLCNKEMKMESVDPAYGPMLRPLLLRPVSGCSKKSSTFSTISSSSCCCIQNPNILSWNHHLSGENCGYGARREINVMTNMPLVSTRWNPTGEQLHALEEMYRRGMRTPSAEQIQQIAAKLRKFGKIEGKNVFYWFQNHKARERQKKRRQLEFQAAKKLCDIEVKERKPKGLNNRYLQIEPAKKLPILSDCLTPKPSEDSVSMHGAVTAECKKDGWTQLNQKKFQNQIQIITTKNAWKLDLSSSDTVSHADNINIGELNLITRFLPLKNEIIDSEIIRENHTLQLFPVRRNDDLILRSPNCSLMSGGEGETQTKFTPSEFIEFLPTKN